MRMIKVMSDVEPIRASDKNKSPRKWFWGGDAFHQANNEKRMNERVYPVSIRVSNGDKDKFVDGWALGVES